MTMRNSRLSSYVARLDRVRNDCGFVATSGSGKNNFGIMSGMDIVVGNDGLSLSVTNGEFFLNGVLYKHNGTTGLLPTLVASAPSLITSQNYLVVLELYKVTENKQTWANQSVEASFYYDFRVSLVEKTAFDSQLGSIRFVLARVSYNIVQLSSLQTILPSLLGGYDLGTINTSFNDNIYTEIQSRLSNILYYSNIQAKQNNILLVGYRAVANEPSGQIVEDYKLEFLRYVVSYNDARWIPCLPSEFGLPHNKTYQELYDYLTRFNLEIVKLTSYPSSIDFSHRPNQNKATQETNAHLLRFADVDTVANNEVTLLGQVFDSGFAVSEQVVQGVSGYEVVENVNNLDIRTDWFGDVTNVLKNKYIVTSKLPLSVNAVSRKVDNKRVPFLLQDSLIVLGVDFPGGAITEEPWNWTKTYNKDTRVSRNGIRYMFLQDYVPANNTSTEEDKWVSSIVVEVPRYDLVVRYNANDLASYQQLDNEITFKSSVGTIVTQGRCLEGTVSAAYNTAPHKGVGRNFVLSLNGEGKLVSSLKLSGSIQLPETRKQIGKDFVTPHQVDILVRNTPIPDQVHRCLGSLSAEGQFISDFSFFYRIRYNERIAATSSSNQFPVESLVLDTAELLDGNNWVPKQFWKHHKPTSQIVIAEDIYHPSKLFRVLRREATSQRSNIVAIKKNADVPFGRYATAELECLAGCYERMQLGDTIRLTTPFGTIDKVLSDSSDFSSFQKGNNLAQLLANIVTAFQQDPLFVEQNYQIVVSTNKIIITSGQREVAGNSDNIEVSTRFSCFIVRGFSGGDTYKVSLSDLDGITVSINDPRDVDEYSYYEVFASLDGETFSKVTEVSAVPTTNRCEIQITQQDIDTYSSVTYKLQDEFYGLLLVSGKDVSDNTIQATVELSVENITFIENQDVPNPQRFVRLPSVFKSLDNMVLLDHRNLGSAQIVCVLEGVGGTQDMFSVCEVVYDGNRVVKLLDRRKFVDAKLKNPINHILAESMSNAAALLQGDF